MRVFGAGGFGSVFGPPAGDDKAKRERLRARLREHGRPCYVRFGDAPASGVSRTINRGEEPGLSVFPAHEMDGQVWLDPGEGRGLRGALFLSVGQGRPAYLARGRVVGRGAEGEPCLANFSLERIPDSRIRLVWQPSAEELRKYAGAIPGWILGAQAGRWAGL